MSDRGRRLGGLALAGALLLAVAGCGDGGGATGSAAVSPTAEPDAEYQFPGDAEPGTCYDPIVDRDDDALLALRLRDCDEPHFAEVVGQVKLDAGPNAPFPGQAEVDAQAEEVCLVAFEDYVGIAYEDSKLSAAYYDPDEESWAAGDRDVMCVVEGTEASPLTRSIEDFGA